jgi:hypothetical protein
MPSPETTAPFRRLRHVLTRESLGEARREAAQIAMSPDFERVALSPGFRMQARLSAIADLAHLANASFLPTREIDIVLTELGRLALRILWWEGLLGAGMAAEIPGDAAATILIELLASGCLPEGPASTMVMERAKALLERPDVVRALREDTQRRDRLILQLVEAEARLQPLSL